MTLPRRPQGDIPEDFEYTYAAMAEDEEPLPTKRPQPVEHQADIASRSIDFQRPAQEQPADIPVRELPQRPRRKVNLGSIGRRISKAADKIGYGIGRGVGSVVRAGAETGRGFYEGASGKLTRPKSIAQRLGRSMGAFSVSRPIVSKSTSRLPVSEQQMILQEVSSQYPQIYNKLAQYQLKLSEFVAAVRDLHPEIYRSLRDDIKYRYAYSYNVPTYPPGYGVQQPGYGAPPPGPWRF